MRRTGSYTKAGPGRCPQGIRNPAGTKILKHFIKRGSGESTAYRTLLRQVSPRDRMNADHATATGDRRD